MFGIILKSFLKFLQIFKVFKKKNWSARAEVSLSVRLVEISGAYSQLLKKYYFHLIFVDG